MSNPSYEQAVTSWAAHLRDGGTTAWDRFRDEVVHAAAPGVWPLPDSVHLELVRRLNLASGGVAHPGLVDHVLATVAPGRGRVDIPLPWPDSPPRFGIAPMDPVAACVQARQAQTQPLQLLQAPFAARRVEWSLSLAAPSA